MTLHHGSAISPEIPCKGLAQVEDLQNRLTAAEQRELALRAVLAQWQDTFDAFAEPISVLGPDQRILRCNAAMRKLLNLSAEQIIGRYCWEVVHGTHQPLANCPCPMVRESLRREVVTLEYAQRWFEVSVDPRCDDQGRLKGYIHVMSDVTQNVNKESALRESHQTLLTVLDSIDAVIYVADLSTYAILFMNQRMRVLYKHDALDQPCYRVLHDRDEPCEHCQDHPLLDARGKPTDVHVWEGMNAAKTRWYLNQDRAVRWVDGRYVRLHVATDISAVKFLEQERILNESRMRQTQKLEAIGTLAGGIAHDFNNILSAILGYSDLALDDANRGQASPAFIGQIVKAGQRARELVQQILTFSRQTESESKPIQAQPIIKEALKLLRASLPSTIEIQLKIESEAVIQADPVQIHQVIMNLCTNAGHAMRDKGGRLEVTIAEEELDADFTDHYPEMSPGRHLKLEVNDSGHGIDPALIHKIFDPYFTTKEKGEGTGMGLAVVQGIVRGCRGAVSVASKVGQGSLFKLYFPIIQQTEAIAAIVQESVPFGNERILFVDDEVPLTDLGKELLERLGYHVTIRNGSIEALALFERQSNDFDLVITDMTMPRMTGEEMAEKMMTIRSDIPVIICTGYSQRVTQEMMERLAIRALVMKPLIRDKLAVVIRKVLDEGKNSFKCSVLS